MRTLLSQLEMARKSGPFCAGENDSAEMVSVGGSLSAMSDLRSPTDGVDAALEEPKRPDMVTVVVGDVGWLAKQRSFFELGALTRSTVDDRIYLLQIGTLGRIGDYISLKIKVENTARCILGCLSSRSYPVLSPGHRQKDVEAQARPGMQFVMGPGPGRAKKVSVKRNSRLSCMHTALIAGAQNSTRSGALRARDHTKSTNSFFFSFFLFSSSLSHPPFGQQIAVEAYKRRRLMQASFIYSTRFGRKSPDDFYYFLLEILEACGNAPP